MKRRFSVLAAVAVVIAAVLPAAAQADGEAGLVPWAQAIPDSVERTGLMKSSARAAQAAGPGISGLRLVGNSDKDGTVNSDLAFWGDLAYAGNYGGFRILDISDDQPLVLADVACNGPQNDPTVWDTGERRLMFQSVDSRQTTDECTSATTTDPLGFEGIRVFDVTNPRNPRFLDGISTDCGSHTHTLVPDAENERVVLYVSSYPLSGLTPPGGGRNGTECIQPHKKISLVEIPYDFQTEADATVKEQPLSSDTTPAPGRGFQACHDITVIMPTDTAVGACAGDGQIWDISDPMDPTTTDADEGRHTHIRSPSPADTFEFVHTSMITPDLEKFVLTDETGGGGTAECDGPATTDGFYYFYDLVEPGAPARPLISRYTIPRAQTPQICVSHNGNFIPVKNRYIMPAANYQGGTTVVDWTNERKPREVAFADLEDSTGKEDAWSSYWYNGRIYVNGGLNRRNEPPAPPGGGNRGLDVYEFTNNRYNANRAQHLPHLNPQTVDFTLGRPGHGHGRDDDDRGHGRNDDDRDDDRGGGRGRDRDDD
jgi:hypothetical protein